MTAITVIRRYASKRHPGVIYAVTMKGGSGFLSCSCPGFKFRRTCGHVDDVLPTLPGGSPVGLLSSALDYARQGFHVIPVEPGGKIPMVGWLKYQAVAPTSTDIADWWKRWPLANIGLVLTDGRIAVDLDGGAEAEALLTAAGITLPAGAPRVKTASGYHVYLQTPTTMGDRIGLVKGDSARPDASVTPGGKMRVPQVDVRARGIIIAPPSRHHTGVDYAWETPLTFPLPDAPAALVQAMTGQGVLAF